MDSVSTLATARLCIKLFKELKARYAAFKHAEDSVRELVLIIEHHSLKIEKQMEMLRDVWDSLGAPLQVCQNSLLVMLQSKLQYAVVQIDQLIGVAHIEASSTSLLGKKGPIDRGKFAVRLQSTLNKTVEDIESWERRFDPSWYLIARSSAPAIEEHMVRVKPASMGVRRGTVQDMIAGLLMAQSDSDNQTTSIFSSAPSLSSSRYSIPYCPAKLGNNSLDSSSVIIDSRTVDTSSARLMTDGDVRKLARAMQHADPLSWGLLQCLGVIKTVDEEQAVHTFDFVLAVPQPLVRPRALRELLLTVPARHALDERVRLAKLMAKSVAFVHNVGFVHKMVTPETFVVFDDGISALGTPFLVGFERFRLAAGFTLRAGDMAWNANLYRHPQRQGVEPEEDYYMQHDIYSLGVCLLEVGLWTSFVMYDEAPDQGEDDADPKGKAVVSRAKSTRPGPLIAAQMTALSGTKDARQRASRIKAMFVELAETSLPAALGRRYAEVVLTCLECYDRNNSRFGERHEFEDVDGITVGVRFVEKILMQIEEISL